MRQSVFALIEGLLHRTKATTAHIGLALGSISIHELVVIEGTQLEVNDKGEVVAKPLYPPFLNNLKLTFRVFSKSTASPFKLSIGGKGWQYLKESVKVRDRLMHPKDCKDLEVSDLEINATRQACEWFIISYCLCTHQAQRSTVAQGTDRDKDLAVIDENIRILEAKLVARGN